MAPLDALRARGGLSVRACVRVWEVVSWGWWWKHRWLHGSNWTRMSTSHWLLLIGKQAEAAGQRVRGQLLHSWSGIWQMVLEESGDAHCCTLSAKFSAAVICETSARRRGDPVWSDEMTWFDKAHQSWRLCWCPLSSCCIMNPDIISVWSSAWTLVSAEVVEKSFALLLSLHFQLGPKNTLS